jgi:hypothetical protein
MAQTISQPRPSAGKEQTAMMNYKPDATDAPPIHTPSGDIQPTILGQPDNRTSDARRNHRLKKALALIGVVAGIGLIITFFVDRVI